MPTITISENGTATYSGVVDTRLNSAATTTNYASATDLEATSYGAGSRQVSPVKMTMPGVLVGATINSVIARFTQQTGSGVPQTIEFRRILTDWNVAAATWATKDGTTGWADDGAEGSGTDIAAVASATVSMTAGTGVVYDFSSAQLTADFQAFASGGANYGHILRRGEYTADDGKYCVLYSSNAADPATRPVFIIDYTPAAPGATASGATVSSTASLVAGSASASTSATATGKTLTAASSLLYPGGTLAFQAAGMEFGARTGLGISTFALEAGVSYRYSVHADGLTLGAALYTSAAITLDGAGKLPNLAALSWITPGTLYRVHAIRQSDGEAATYRMRALA